MRASRAPSGGDRQRVALGDGSYFQRGPNGGYQLIPASGSYITRTAGGYKMVSGNTKVTRDRPAMMTARAAVEEVAMER